MTIRDHLADLLIQGERMAEHDPCRERRERHRRLRRYLIFRIALLILAEARG